MAGTPFLFDLDGTLWDTTAPVARAWTRATVRADLPARVWQAADIVPLMGLTHEQLWARACPELDREARERLAALCYEEEERELRSAGGSLYPGVADCLRELSRRAPLAIVSNCQRGYIETFLDQTGLAPCFQDFECHGNTGLSKGDNARLLMRRQGWEHAILVGDTLGDENAAREAGCRFLFAAYGFGTASPESERLERFDQLLEVARL